MSKLLTGIYRDLEEEFRSVLLNDNMNLSKLMVHVLQVEDSRKKRSIHDFRRPKPQDQAVSAMEATETILAYVSSAGSKRGNKVQGTLTLRGVQQI